MKRALPETFTLTNVGYDDIFIVKYGNTSNGVEEPVYDAANNYIYPNPLSASGSLHLTNCTGNNVAKSELKIYDVLGSIKHSQSLNFEKETLTLNLPAGIYFYKITSSEDRRKTQTVSNGKLIITD